MTPSVGRIVHVAVDPEENNGQDYAAAVVTRVFSDGMVNVCVLLDSPTGPIQKTSVRLHSERPDDVRHAAWWPPRA